MGSKLNRIGEERLNNFGSEMIIVEYRNRIDIDVYFPEYNWTFKEARYGNFKRGNIKCPYDRSIYGVGYIGEGEYRIKENGKTTKCYNTWHDMLTRCYSDKFHKKRPTYKNCEVCEEWLNFQNFAKWYEDNYYEVKGKKICLDKDILVKGNKTYSPKTCVFVPNDINVLFTKHDNNRGNYPIGVSYNKANKKFIANCNIYDFKENKKKRIYLGCYDTPEKAFEVYKQYKEKYIKEVADYYKDQISRKLSDVLYNYKVEITD